MKVQIQGLDSLGKRFSERDVYRKSIGECSWVLFQKGKTRKKDYKGEKLSWGTVTIMLT